jgi:hypothetical protein
MLNRNLTLFYDPSHDRLPSFNNISILEELGQVAAQSDVPCRRRRLIAPHTPITTQ